MGMSIQAFLKFCISYAFSILNKAENLLKIETSDSKDDQPSQDQDHPILGRSSESSTVSSKTALKRLKLVLDISLSPGGSRIVNVSTKDILSIREKFFSMQAVAKMMLSTIKAIKRILSIISRVLLPNEKFLELNVLNDEQQQQHPIRIIKSPKRRISYIKRILSEFPFCALGVRVTSTECLITLPGNEESKSPTQSYSKNKGNGKRKLSVELDSLEEESYEEEIEDPKETLEKSSKIPQEDQVDIKLIITTSPTTNEDIQTFDSCESGGSSSTEQEQSKLLQPSLTQLLLDMTEDDYESAEDPDYTPQGSISTSSDDSQSHLDESDIQNELSNLRVEAVEDLAALLANNEKNIQDESVEVADVVRENYDKPQPQDITIDNRDDDNEVEYTNGQARMTELGVHRNPLFARHRRFYETETEASSPFSMNPSEPSMPNTPHSFNGSFQSHQDSP